MGKQFSSLQKTHIEFIQEQKVFYIASSSGKEVNLSPKGYDSIRVLDESTLLFLDFAGSGNRTFRDTQNDGEFTVLFNSYDEKAMILRMFCKAELVEKESDAFLKYFAMFNEKKSQIRNFFLFKIYGVESSCGEGIPYMEYKGERASLKNWIEKMDESEKLQKYITDHETPPDMKNLKN